MTKQHELPGWLEAVADELKTSYEDIRRRVDEDPGTAGDRGEEVWAEFFRDWLPSNYIVETKGRIIGVSGAAGPQLDVVVLRPGYPKALRSKKLYLAEGVALAAECKLTLTREHVVKAAKSAQELAALERPRPGTPYRDIYRSFRYGILAHSHSWKNEGSTPIDNVTRAVRDLDRPASPRGMLDFICIADLCTWLRSSHINRRRNRKPEIDQKLGFDEDETHEVVSGLWPPRNVASVRSSLGTFYRGAINALAWEDPSLRHLASHTEQLSAAVRFYPGAAM